MTDARGADGESAVRMHLDHDDSPRARDVEMQAPASNGHAAPQQKAEHGNGSASPDAKDASALQLDDAHRKVDGHTYDKHAHHTGAAAKSGKEAAWKKNLRRRWKHTSLYETTSTGHEDACAFECSNVSGRRLRYWPPLYAEADLKASCWLRVKRFYVFYMRPGIWMGLAVLLSLYWFATMNNIATWRTNGMADKHGYLPPNSAPNSEREAARQLPEDKIFILDDIVHLLIPAANDESYVRWHGFVDGSLVVAIVVSLLLRLCMRDMVRLGEWAAIAITLFFMNGFLHVLTVYPDPWGSNLSCQNPDHREYGAWIFYNWKFEYCGDSMFSGHTFNFIVAMVMLRRVIYDLLGWDTLPLTTFTHSAVTYRRAHDLITQLGAGKHGGPVAAHAVQAGGGSADKHDPGTDLSAPGHTSDDQTRNPAVLTKHIDATSLPGCDKDGELLEAMEPLPMGSATLMAVKLAEAEGLGDERALELGRMLRYPIHGHKDIEAQESSELLKQLHEPHRRTPSEEKKFATSNAMVPRHDPYTVNAQLSHEARVAQLQTSVLMAEATSGANGQSNGDGKASPDQSSLMHTSDKSSGPHAQGIHGRRVVMISNGPLGDCAMSSLPPNASHNHAPDAVPVPKLLRTTPFQLSAPIPASHGGPHVGGHYGACEGSVNESCVRPSERHHSDLPCPEWDDVRGHGMNAFYRYRINMPVRERIIMSRAPPPYFARRHPRATWWIANLIRLAVFCWTGIFLAGIIRIRYHYGADVFVSIFFTLLVVCNEKLIQTMVPYLYRPVDARYADAPMYPFSIDPQLYEETLSKLGVGGII